MDSKIFKVTIEGQTMDLPAEIAGDDVKLKQALSPYFPGAANAKIVRAEAGDVVTVNVIKQAGTKGLFPLPETPLQILTGLPESQNPVMALYQELINVDPRSLSTEQQLDLDARVRGEVAEGENQRRDIQDTLRLLKVARAVPGNTVPEGL